MPETRTLGAQLLHQKFADASAVGVAAGRFHHLSYEEADDLLVAVADALGLVGIGGDGLVHDAGELVRADRGEALALHNGRGRIAGLEDPVKGRPGRGAGDVSPGDQLDELRHVRRLHLRVGDVRRRFVEEGPQVAGDPVGGLFGVHLSRDRLVERREVPVGREHASVVFGEAILLDEAGEHVLGQLGKLGLYVPHVRRRHLQGEQVRLREIAVVVGVLLAAELVHLVGLGIVVERGLLDTAAATQYLTLPLQLPRQAPLDEAEGVHVLELGLGTERAVGVANGDVGVAAELALLHVRLRDADRPKDLFQLVGRRADGFRRWDVGFGDDLHKGCAAAVEVHQGADRAVHAAGGADVDVLGRVFLQVEARDADADLALVRGNLQVAARADRLVELGDLVPLREVGVEVVLPGEDGPLGHVAVEGQPRHDPEIYGLLVGDGQGPGVPEANGAGVGVGGLPVCDPATAEHLGLGRQVDVELQSYDRRVRTRFLHFQVGPPCQTRLPLRFHSSTI